MVCRGLLVGLLFRLIVRTASADTINTGLFHLNLGVQAGVQWTDNFNNSQTKPKENIYLLAGPYLDGGLALPLHLVTSTGENLTLATSFAYSEEYSLSGNPNTREFSSPVIFSLSIPVQVGDWKLSLSEGFTFIDQPLESSLAVNSDTFAQYNNILTVDAVRDFGKASITFEGQRRDQITPAVPENDEVDYQFSVTPSILIRDNYSLYWQNTYGFNYLRTGILQNSEGYTSVVGVNGQITPNLNGSISVGYAHSYLIPLNLGPGTGIFGGIFNPVLLKGHNIDGITSTISASYAHPLRPNTTYSIALYHSPGVTAILKNSSIDDVYGATVRLTHRLTKDLTLSPTFGYTHIQNEGQTAPGQISEISDFMQFNIELDKSFTDNLTGMLTYEYQTRTSNIFGNNYKTQIATFILRYIF